MYHNLDGFPYNAGRGHAKIKNLPEASVDRITRKELKQDRFAQEVGRTFEYLSEHKKQLIRYGAAALAVVLIMLAAFYFTRRQRIARQEELHAAMELLAAPVGAPAAPGAKSFASDAEKDAAVTKALNDIINRSPRSDEAAVAQYLLGARAADEGRLDEASRLLESAAKSGNREYASLAKLALAEVYGVRGKRAEAEKLLRELINQPTVLVSKGAATLALARLMAPSQPQEALKLLAPLRDAPGELGRAAITAYGDIALRNKPLGS